jgi:hypothetical protein
MKVILFFILTSAVLAFQPSNPTRTSRSPATKLLMTDDKQTITDLNLEEMYEVFEAADKSIPTSGKST